jgi:predicted CopG family antitoxin
MHVQCMAVKTITIDLEAYGILARRKRPGQSFSQVIKEALGPSQRASDLRAVVVRLGMSREVVDSVERQVRRRPAHRARTMRL